MFIWLYQEYFSTIVPRVIDLLQESSHPAYRRSAAFALSQMLSVDGGIAAKIIIEKLHGPLLHVVPDAETTAATTTLEILGTLLTNSDPSPKIISSLLSPIVPALYGLLFHLDSIKISDPELKEMVRGLLMTWSRIVSTSEAIDVLWSIFDDESGQWQTDLVGSARRVMRSVTVPISSTEAHHALYRTQSSIKPSLFTPEDLKKAQESGELDAGANLLDLYPEPRHLATFLKSTNRDDILSQVFVRLLEGYRDSKNDENENPLRFVVGFLQDCSLKMFFS